MTATITIEPDDPATQTTSAIAAPTGTDSADSERLSHRRKTVSATSVVAVIAAVAALVGILFPGMFAAAVAISMLAVIVALDWLLRPRELQQAPQGYWTF